MEDEKIIELYRRRDREAIAETEKKYGGYLFAVAGNILQSHEDAEECVNDTYFKVWNSIPPAWPKVFSAFLGKITRNLAFSRYRRERAEKRGGGEVTLILDELEECISGDNSTEKAVEMSELKETLNAFLRGLSEDKRNLFLRRYWYCDSISEISKSFSVSEASVRMKLMRLREKLRLYLTERGFEA